MHDGEDDGGESTPPLLTRMMMHAAADDGDESTPPALTMMMMMHDAADDGDDKAKTGGGKRHGKRMPMMSGAYGGNGDDNVLWRGQR